MKAEKARRSAGHKKARRSPAPKQRSAIPPDARRSTAAALLRHAAGWAGDDLDEVMKIVAGTRAKTRF